MLHRKLRAAASLAAALVVSVVTAVSVSAAPPTGLSATSCVADNANILNSDTETYLTNLSCALQETCGAQIGVYTVDYIGNDTMEGYAYEVFQAWGLGSSKEDNGLLLLLATGEDNYWATPGEGLENAFTGNTLSDLLYDNLESAWVKQDYDTGTRQTVLAMAQRIANYYNLDLDLAAIAEGRVTADGTPVEVQPQKKSSGMGRTLMTILILTIVVIVLIAIFTAPRGPRGPRGLRGPRFIIFGGPRAPRPPRRRTPPPPPPPRGGYSGGMGNPGPRPGGGNFRAGGGSTRGGGAGRPGGFSGGASGFRGGGFSSGGGSFRAGGGSTRGGGAGRR